MSKLTVEQFSNQVITTKLAEIYSFKLSLELDVVLECKNGSWLFPVYKVKAEIRLGKTLGELSREIIYTTSSISLAIEEYNKLNSGDYER